MSTTTAATGSKVLLTHPTKQIRVGHRGSLQQCTFCDGHCPWRPFVVRYRGSSIDFLFVVNPDLAEVASVDFDFATLLFGRYHTL